MTDIRASFPLTFRHLGNAAPAARSAEEFVRAVCEAHAKGDIPSRAVRDLVHYEALLLEVGPLPGAPGPTPRDNERVVLSPHIRLLVFGGGLPEMLEALRAGKPAKARPSRGWFVLWKGGELRFFREEGWFLESFREPVRVEENVEDGPTREAFDHFWRAGIIVRA